jgi:hypothetical protein
MRNHLKVIGVLALLIAALFFTPLALPIELTEPEAAAHAYPALLDLHGKKLANGEFMQWIQNDRLHVTISYKFSDGQRFPGRLDDPHRAHPAKLRRWSVSNGCFRGDLFCAVSDSVPLFSLLVPR